MINRKTAFVTFFPIIPNNMGSSAVVNSRFKCWPNRKKIFQISHLKNINNKHIKTIFINKEKPINKIIKHYSHIPNNKLKAKVIDIANYKIKKRVNDS